MVKLGDPHPRGTLAIAQSLAEQGLQVLPAKFKDKAPIVKWTEYQDRRTESLLPTWFGGGTQRNYWVMTGRMSQHVVVDADSPEGDKWWRNQLGDEIFDATAQVQTYKGKHYWFAIPADWNPERAIASWSVHPQTPDDDPTSFDFRADGTGVIVPPSVHEKGHQYAWLIPLDEAVLAPPAMLTGGLRASAPHPSGAVAGSTAGDRAGGTRSMLATLLGRPPGGDGSGRNDWLARVAGHYAKTYHNLEDLYLTHCAAANQMMGEPLDEDEYTKTVASVWRGEHERNKHRAMDETCGWLQSGGTRLMTQVVKKGDDEQKAYDLAEYADFDLAAKGVMLDEEQGRTYWVQIVRKRRGVGDTETIDAVLPAHVTGDDKALRKWLAKFACTVVPPENIWPRVGSVGVRLQRYLESQHPPEVKVTSVLGWDPDIINGSGGFVTHDSIITAEEAFTCEAVGVRPNPQLLVGGTAPHRYGFESDQGEARRVLAEVLTFHEETVTAVFGAWWAACLLKPQTMQESSMFPFMAIEAASESGKTNGFFEMMTQMNGNTRGESVPTYAALRDMAAAHRNGIVWIDDLDDTTRLFELLRAATSGGSITKMGEDRESVKNTQIVSPIVISGEGLGLGNQKALLDRAIILKVGSPTGRRSRHNSLRPQWDDVLELRREYPHGLADLAGWWVQQALSYSDSYLAALAEGRRGQGRAGDKAAILRAGARLLDAMLSETAQDESDAWLGAGMHALAVEDWLGPDADEVKIAENMLTLEIIPWALRDFNYPDAAKSGEALGNRFTDAPAWIRQQGTAQATLDVTEGTEIWYSPALLAHAWERYKHGRTDQRTQTESALRDQSDALGGGRGKQWKISGGGGRKHYYRVLRGPIVQAVLNRAQGIQ